MGVNYTIHILSQGANDEFSGLVRQYGARVHAEDNDAKNALNYMYHADVLLKSPSSMSMIGELITSAPCVRSIDTEKGLNTSLLQLAGCGSGLLERIKERVAGVGSFLKRSSEWEKKRKKKVLESGAARPPHST